ncbi:oxidoreductase [Bosea sp. Leaf344]|uniref:protein-methionine-sulfoxide reductase catalytic subunit MsrP n=1 Tax=Bosea sp. Leaf344 TaxID=1736346 RepID=UPI0006FA9611|nr:protein-methionine-sulfoxide reductase catalytic subunit MsrP [Bosea sp. Leaf344]KQU51783.1 oxidoreductase [Bosea sp. Leaf344]
MLIKTRPGWAIRESEATPESVFLNRRSLLGAGAGLIASAALPRIASAQAKDPTADLYPARRNEAFTLDRPVTDEDLAANYNNFYEFGTSKDVVAAASRMPTRPWTVAIDGLVEKPFEIGVDELIRKMPLEERLYRFRCVESWSMAVPWTGFPLKALVALAKPLSGAKYVQMQTFMNPKVAPGQAQRWYPWPYTEGLTMAEAGNDLTLLVTGVYGKPLANQFGAPIRLITPWKYGFKSVKSITKISFVAERPKTFWEGLQPAEYGFWANVNPAVPHPRWTQASEQVLGTRERRPTLLFNGYAEQVAEMYKGLEGERLYV